MSSAPPSSGPFSFSPLQHKGIPIEEQPRAWSDLVTRPFARQEIHPYSRARALLVNSVELEAVTFSHQMARNTLDPEVRRRLGWLRRIEAQQQKAVSALLPGDDSALSVTLGYEQAAVDLTAFIAQAEPDPYLRQVYDFALIEDFDHLYRYANLYQLLEGHRAEEVCGDLTEIMPGRPTCFEHRDPCDEVRRPLTVLAAHPQSVLNALTLVATAQQAMNFYMAVGPRHQEPIARALYAEIAMVEEQHVTHYESILDPTASWLQNLVLHQWHECWVYWSAAAEEPEPQARQLYETCLAMEIEQLRLACDLMCTVEKRDPESILPLPAFTTPLSFRESKSYVRQVLARQTDLTAKLSDFVPVSTLPGDDRYFVYQRCVNGDWSPSEAVIRQNAAASGAEYRLETDGPHPVPGLRRPAERGEEETAYARHARLAA